MPFRNTFYHSLSLLLCRLVFHLTHLVFEELVFDVLEKYEDFRRSMCIQYWRKDSFISYFIYLLNSSVQVIFAEFLNNFHLKGMEFIQLCTFSTSEEMLHKVLVEFIAKWPKYFKQIQTLFLEFFRSRSGIYLASHFY